MQPPPATGDALAECLRLLAELPAAAASSPAFRRHWPSISASVSSLSASLSHPAFPPSAPLLSPLASALQALLSVCGGPSLGHLHTVSLLSSSAASLSQLAADARLLVSPSPAGGEGDGSDSLLPRLRLGSAVSRAAALDSLAESVGSMPASHTAAAVSAVAAMLDSGDLLPASRDKAVSVLAAFASSDAGCLFLAQESGTVVPHLCRALESGGASAEQACVALEPLTASSRDAAAAVSARGGVAALLVACAAGTPASQAAAAGVLRNIAAFPDLLPAFRDEGALPLIVQLVSLGTPRTQELALGCLQNLTASDGDEGQRLKVEAFQEGALGCVKDFLESCRGDGPGLAPAYGLLRNMATFRYIAEIAVSAGFVSHVLAALGSERASTRTEAAMALAELCSVSSSSKARKEAGGAMPRLIWMLEAKSVGERDAAARALATLVVAASSHRKVFKKDEMGIVNAVQLLDPAVRGADKRFPVSLLLAVSQSRRCRKQMVAAGACGFLQGLLAAEVDGAKKLSECLGRGKMLGVFPRT
ncbi:U-box domain-containing protein 11-like [Hordeum vulgare]|nr:U-box domain-containing protein 11-like [Hordeum vulgare]